MLIIALYGVISLGSLYNENSAVLKVEDLNLDMIGYNYTELPNLENESELWGNSNYTLHSFNISNDNESFILQIVVIGESDTDSFSDVRDVKEKVSNIINSNGLSYMNTDNNPLVVRYVDKKFYVIQMQNNTNKNHNNEEFLDTIVISNNDLFDVGGNDVPVSNDSSAVYDRYCIVHGWVKTGSDFLCQDCLNEENPAKTSKNYRKCPNHKDRGDGICDYCLHRVNKFDIF